MRPPMPTHAVELLLRVLIEITVGDRPWVQRFYALTQFDRTGNVCGSAHCLAGNVCLAAGHSIVPDRNRISRSDYPCPIQLHPDAVELSTYGSVSGQADAVDQSGIAKVAQGLLGITFDEADELFDADGTLAGLWEQAERLSDGRIRIPADLVALVDDRTVTRVTVPA